VRGYGTTAREIHCTSRMSREDAASEVKVGLDLK
jgi:hypothetical protein